MTQVTDKKKRSLKVFDFVAVGLAAALTIGSGVLVYGRSRAEEKSQVYIQGPAQSWVFPIDADETIPVPGPLGTTVVRIHGGDAWVVSSPCDNQTCVAAGHVHLNGQWVACLPNAVFVMVMDEGSGDDQEFDAGTW
jgi:hypothetical protein